MKKLLLQSGHKNRTVGATGAPDERNWNIWCTDLVKEYLKDKVDVTIIDADHWSKEVQEDYDLFLSVHYDADIYNDTGGFTGYPEPSTDYATAESQRISQEIGEYFFKGTGIAWKKARSAVRNIKYYYMWKYLSADTPCVLIECGIGWRKPEDYETLRKTTTPQILANAILSALGESENNMTSDCIKDFDANEDIAGEIELKFNPPLKSYEQYDKHISWQQLVNQWNDYFQKTIEQAKDIVNLNEALASAEELCQAKVDDAVNGYIQKLEDLENELADVREKSEEALKVCNTEKEVIRKKLEACEAGQVGKPLCEYPSWERFKSLFVCPKSGGSEGGAENG